MATPPERLMQAAAKRQARVQELKAQRMQRQQSGGSGGSVPQSAPVKKPVSRVKKEADRRGSDPTHRPSRPSASARDSDAASSVAAKKKTPKMSSCAQRVQQLAKEREARRVKQQDERERRQRVLNNDKGKLVAENYQKMIAAYRKDNPVAPRGKRAPGRDRIRVCVRKRPLLPREKAQTDVDVLTTNPSDSTVVVHEPKQKVDMSQYMQHQNFLFDEVFDENEDNKTVYKYTVRPLISDVFENRGAATCFAFGQTASGKTYTMNGTPKMPGLYTLTARDVLAALKDRPELSAHVSFYEIYGGKVFDLLNRKKRLEIREDARGSVRVIGIRETHIRTVDELLNAISEGAQERSSASTHMNDASSRSHAVLTIAIREDVGSGPLRPYGTFSLVDLAGSERGADTASSDRQTRLEGAEINRSLLALKECIRALSSDKSHTPFRASKLTLVLKDSFVGRNSRCVMVANVSPGSASCEHTLNTLRYAERVKDSQQMRAAARARGEIIPDDDDTEGQSDLDDDDDDEEFDEEDSELSDNELLIKDDFKALQRSIKVEKRKSMGADEIKEYQQFHNAVDTILTQEERALQSHRALVDADEEMLAEERELLQYIDSMECDIDFYVASVGDIIQRKIEMFTKFQAQIHRLKNDLAREEMASRQVSKRGGLGGYL